MNQEKIKIEAYNEALEIVNKYKHDNKRLSLKQKAIYKKSKRIIEEYEAQEAKGQQNGGQGKKDGKKDQLQGADRFNQDRNSIFDTKKGQVLFELQKSYKGDERFRLDKRFAEDIDAEKLPNTLKQLTTGIDFENLSDGSDYEFKKKQSKQKKNEKKQEKQLKKTQQLNEIQLKGEKVPLSEQASEDEGEKKQAEGQKGQLFGFGAGKNGADDDANQNDSDSDFFTIKVKQDDEEEEEENDKKKSSKNKLRKGSADETKQKSNKKRGRESSSDEQEEEDEEDDEEQVVKRLNEEMKDQNDEYSDSDSIQKVQFDEEDQQDDDGGKQFRKAYRIAKDYIDQEALVDEDDIQEFTLEEEQHTYLKILQELMPTEKLFFQNKKKNVKVIHNKQSSYAAMLTQEEAQTMSGKKKNKNKSKVEENNQEEDNEENQNEENQQHKKKAKSGFDKDFNSDDNNDEDQFGRQKSEKAYNLVIPRFDPSQLVVKKVMQAQENEKIQKLKEQESKKKQKKSTEAKIEAGIDKKLQKIMKANSILDKNLTEHRKLEGVEKVQKKAPVLKKLKIDSDKWKNIINETSTIKHETEKSIEQSNQQQTQSQKSQSNTKQTVVSNTKEQQQVKPKQLGRSPAQPTNHHTSLGMLFATFQPDANQEGSRSQFKLFG
ncbi:hypothetical protein TTHERM_01087850 (macronuclear) [Tetrahymena thermophila SB210]|uniref:Uncharacterized protein n=1 Tax=Tetrahymena thermophila (strain SB210) TaxID=312017 RepID=Q23M81_TETTS|nr:hypothetical protein TTHERM_01087850 [Tetrahymena thermophila SB210]EAR97632.1 hypothetical protein TTHERM_01087850 [Tetrahymena thermophila SB210]|eukprot:XP_001017877.1 hypothetical protein TTHERM_01087850 [Tetrahymena thermophila SB210]